MSMDIIDDMLEGDFCVYWPFTGTNPDDSVIYGLAIELPCRWEDNSEQFMTPSSKDVQTSKAVVYVPEDLTLRGALWHGSLNEVTDPNDPMANEGALEIRGFSKIPTFDQDQWVRRAYL